MSAGNADAGRGAASGHAGPDGRAAPERAAATDSQPVPLLRQGISPAPGHGADSSSAGPWPAGLPAGARPARNAVIGAAVAGYAWLLGGAAPFSIRALIGVLLPGAVLGVIAFARPPERIPAPESVDVAGFSYWLIFIALVFEWEASAVRGNSSPSHPSLTDLINPLIAPHPIKTAAIVVWLLAGWALVRR